MLIQKDGLSRCFQQGCDYMAIQVEGIEEVIKQMEEKLGTKQIKQNMEKACAILERAAKQKAPKGTGELRRSITSEVRDGGSSIEGTVFTPLEYAPYVEYGTGLFAEQGGRKDVPWSYKDDRGQWHTTSGMHPQPYMRPALDESRTQIIEALKEGIG